MLDQILSLIDSDIRLIQFLTAGNLGGLLNAINSEVVDRVDSTLYGPGSLKRKLPPEVIAAASSAFKAAALQDDEMWFLAQTYASCGFDFSSDETRESLDKLVEGGMPSQIADALKGVGRWKETRLGFDVTPEQLTEALALRERRMLGHAIAERYNATVAALEAGEVTTLEDAKAFFAGA